MSDATSEFFAELDRSGGERLLRKTIGTVRFDIEHDQEIDHWFVTINHGDIEVSRENRDADCVIRTDSVFFERMIRGDVKPIPAWLRHDFLIEGQSRFVILLERLLPGPPSARHPRTIAHECEQQS